MVVTSRILPVASPWLQDRRGQRRLSQEANTSREAECSTEYHSILHG